MIPHGAWKIIPIVLLKRSLGIIFESITIAENRIGGKVGDEGLEPKTTWLSSRCSRAIWSSQPMIDLTSRGEAKICEARGGVEALLGGRV